MTDDNTTPPTTGTVPDVAETNLPQRKSMSEDTDRKDRAYRQAVERKFEIERLQRDLKDRDDKIAALTKERDDAVKVADETKAAYEEFTNENALQRRIGELERTIKYRDTMDMFNSIEGVEYHEGVTLDDLFSAAGVDFDSLDEIPEDFTTKVLEAAKAKKPFLFAVSGSAEPQTGEVPQETAASAPALKAFGAQAAGGGAAPPAAIGSPSNVDWRDPAAVRQYAARHNG
jgi:hypothetical protein